jgi:hypothetical protein
MQHCPRSERIAAGAAEGVPVNHGEPQVVAHRLAFDNFVSLVVFECERIFGPGPFVGDGLNVGECRFHSAAVWVAGVSTAQYKRSVKGIYILPGDRRQKL